MPVNDLVTYGFRYGLNTKQEINVSAISGRLNFDSAHLFRPHRIDFNLMIWVKEGSGVHFIDFKPVKIEPGMLLFIGRGKVHSFDPDGDYDGPSVVFTDEFFCSEERNMGLLYYSDLFNNPFGLNSQRMIADSSLFSFIFKELKNEIKKPFDPYQYRILHNYLNNLLLLSIRERDVMVFDNRNLSGKDLEYITAFKQLLETNLTKRLSVVDYAEILNITERKLQRVTFNVLGKSPKVIIDERLILEAKRLLVLKSDQIRQISDQLGFSEVTNFVKFFKKTVGLTPSVFRKKKL